MMKVKATVLALSAVVMLSSGPALADRLKCTMNPGAAKFYIAPVVILEVSDFGRVRVTDAIIESTNTDFVNGEVATDTAQRLSVHWVVKNVKPDPKEYRYRDAALVVRLTIEKASGAAVMTVLDAEMAGNQHRAEGRCQRPD